MTNKNFIKTLWLWALLMVVGNVSAQVTTQEEFVSACANAVSGDVITLGSGEFAIGPVDINGKTLTFKGQGATNTKIYIGNGGYDGNGGHGSSKTANMTFEDLELADLAANSGYLTGFTEAAGLTFRNVTFNVGFSNWGNKGGDVSFYNCTFNQTLSDKYCIQELRCAPNTKFLFDGCEMTAAGRFINAYKQGGKSTKIEVTVKDCQFHSTAVKYGAVYLKNATNNGNDGCSIDLKFEGTNTIDGNYITRESTKTGSALFQEKGTSDATVYVGGIKIWENSAKTADYIAPEDYIPSTDTTDDTPAVYIPEDLTVEGADENNQDAHDAIIELAHNDNVNADDANNVEDVEDVDALTINLTNVVFDEDAETTTITKVVYDVQPMNGDTEVNETSEPITFRLPVPQSFTNSIVKVSHNHNSNIDEFSSFVMGNGANKYVELSSNKFSEWTIEDIPTLDNLEITTTEELVALSVYVNEGHNMAGQTIKLGNNIDMQDVAFTPIGTSTTKFAGTFDGQNYNISNLTINGDSYIGLFGYVSAASIQNVNLVSANISGVKRVGALIGQIAGAATVENCSTDATSTITGSDSNTGGLIGEVSGKVTVNLTDLTNNAQVTNTENGTSRAAGILGQITSSAVVNITNCTNTGIITANNYAGGIVSAKQPGNVLFTNCSNTGTLEAPHTGSMVAWICNGGEVTLDAYIEGSIGAISADNYSYKLIFGEKEYYIHTGGDATDSFNDYWAEKDIISARKMKVIGDFFKYAKSVNSNFAGYPEEPYEIFCNAWNVSPSGYDKMKTSFFNTDPDSGWPALLAAFQTTPEGEGVTVEDFDCTWTWNCLYSVGDVVAVITTTNDTHTLYTKTDDIVLEDANIKSVVVNEDAYVNSITYKRTFNKSYGSWQSWIVPFNTQVAPEKAQFAKLIQFAYLDDDQKVVDDIKDGKLYIIIEKLFAGDEVHANYPYFVKVETQGEHEFTSCDNHLFTTTPHTLQANTTTTEIVFHGVYNQTTLRDIYMLNTSGQYSHMTEDKVVNPYRWYFTIESKNAYGEDNSANFPEYAKILVLGEDEEATAILNIINSQKNDDAMYDLSGRRIQNAQKGVYIVNGKKYIK